DQLGDADLDALLLARDVAFQAHAFEILVRGDQRKTRRAFVDLATLDADTTVLDHVDAAITVRADGGAHLVDDVDERHRGAVERDGYAALEADDELARFARSIADVARERERFLGRCRPRV